MFFNFFDELQNDTDLMQNESSNYCSLETTKIGNNEL